MGQRTQGGTEDLRGRDHFLHAVLALAFLAAGAQGGEDCRDALNSGGAEEKSPSLALTVAARGEFSLVPQASAWPGISHLAPLSFPAAYERLKAAAQTKKRPWLAAAEVFSLDLINWAIDRYPLNRVWARVGFKVWADNFRQGLIFDPDTFAMNFFLHPYSGSMYFNAARSQGLGFWASTPYALGGSLIWEMFAENQPPSPNDLIMTTTGGIMLGETLFRLSSLVLDDTDTGWSRAGREALVLFIDPVREINRLLFGDAFRRQSVNRQLRSAFHGSFGLRAYYVSETDDFSKLRFSPGLEFEFVLGESTAAQPARGPYDLLFFNSSLRTYQKRMFFSLSAYALLYGNETFGPTGRRTLLGIFQNYDFINNELIELGGSSFTAGIDWSRPLRKDLTFRFTAQLGAMIFGASNNKYTLIEERDYNYGLGSVSKVDARLSHPAFGRLLLRWNRFNIYTIRATALSGAESNDFLSIYGAQYGLNLWRKLAFQVELTLFRRHMQFEGRPAYDTGLSQLDASIVIFF